ncbi:RNA splicing factor Pad-1 [Pseudohyphozyma bogoriensis]|nr:RNA splicing factor Pad-1 [Pseudohyphozyma bogoriensis]
MYSEQMEHSSPQREASYRRRSPEYDPYARDSRPSRRRSQSPELTEEQREMRSVFVSQLSARVLDRELARFFEANAGKVRDARVIVDRISRRSKGVGYVEFVELESVQKALALSNTKLLGIPIIVQYTEAEKNRQARDGLPQTQATGLYVGSLNFALTESDVRQVFQPFGDVDVVDLQKDPVTGKSKGYAFVQFKDPKDAMQALEKMNNFPLAGREIKVGLVSERPAASFQRHEPINLDEGAGGNLNNISRIELMQKLARSEQPTIDLPKPSMFRPNIPQATTRNVLLKDAFNPEEETERDWDLELRDDVKSEVEEKYGKVGEIFVVKESQGEIYIRFETVDAATVAVQGLNGRWFGGRQISASMLADSIFDAKKP